MGSGDGSEADPRRADRRLAAVMMKKRCSERAPGLVVVGPELPPVCMNAWSSLGVGGDVLEERLGQRVGLYIPLGPVVQIIVSAMRVLMTADVMGMESDVGKGG